MVTREQQEKDTSMDPETPPPPQQQQLQLQLQYRPQEPQTPAGEQGIIVVVGKDDWSDVEERTRWLVRSRNEKHKNSSKRTSLWRWKLGSSSSWRTTKTRQWNKRHHCRLQGQHHRHRHHRPTVNSKSQ